MSTPYTLIRGRVKDLISCFNACKLPIDKDDDESDRRKPTPSSIADARKRERGKKQVETGTTESPASWQSCESEEDDYIVLYFKNDDGGGGIIEEGSSERTQNVVGSVRRKKKNAPEIEELNESVEHGDALGESSDSSTSSFVFPAVQREWTGSPVLMPRPEGHNKSGGVCVQCCKF